MEEDSDDSDALDMEDFDPDVDDLVVGKAQNVTTREPQFEMSFRNYKILSLNLFQRHKIWILALRRVEHTT